MVMLLLGLYICFREKNKKVEGEDIVLDSKIISRENQHLDFRQ